MNNNIITYELFKVSEKPLCCHLIVILVGLYLNKMNCHVGNLLKVLILLKSCIIYQTLFQTFITGFVIYYKISHI